jgi:hypothetical protein
MSPAFRTFSAGLFRQFFVYFHIDIWPKLSLS